MKCFSKNKKAFTLLEMMISIAIMCLTAAAFFSLILTTRQAHLKVYDVNEACTYATLNAHALENTILNYDTFGISASGGSTHRISTDSTFITLDGTQVFSYDIKNQSGVDKWRMTLSVSMDPSDSEVVNYVITAYSNITGDVVYTYTGSVWLPHSNDNGKPDTSGCTGNQLYVTLE